MLVSVSLCKGWWLCLVIFKKQGSSNTCNHQDLVFNEWNLSNAPCPLPPLSIIPKGKGLLNSTSSRKISNLSSYRLQKSVNKTETLELLALKASWKQDIRDTRKDFSLTWKCRRNCNSTGSPWLQKANNTPMNNYCILHEMTHKYTFLFFFFLSVSRLYSLSEVILFNIQWDTKYWHFTLLPTRIQTLICHIVKDPTKARKKD